MDPARRSTLDMRFSKPPQAAAQHGAQRLALRALMLRARLKTGISTAASGNHGPDSAWAAHNQQLYSRPLNAVRAVNRVWTL